jgi:hypothetical protein
LRSWPPCSASRCSRSSPRCSRCAAWQSPRSASPRAKASRYPAKSACSSLQSLWSARSPSSRTCNWSTPAPARWSPSSSAWSSAASRWSIWWARSRSQSAPVPAHAAPGTPPRWSPCGASSTTRSAHGATSRASV